MMLGKSACQKQKSKTSSSEVEIGFFRGAFSGQNQLSWPLGDRRGLQYDQMR